MYEELLQKRREYEEECLRKEKELKDEENERKQMKENDSNVLKIGKRLSDEPFIKLSPEELRKKRLERFKRG